jgi:hypothetical protein
MTGDDARSAEGQRLHLAVRRERLRHRGSL